MSPIARNFVTFHILRQSRAVGTGSRSRRVMICQRERSSRSGGTINPSIIMFTMRTVRLVSAISAIHDSRVELIELRFHFRPIQITNGSYKLEVYIPSIKKLLEYPACSLSELDAACFPNLSVNSVARSKKFVLLFFYEHHNLRFKRFS